MRCKCCDSSNTKFTLGDWYCTQCAKSISDTIKEDKNLEVDRVYYLLNKEKKDGE